jgi:hypothetical protein
MGFWDYWWRKCKSIGEIFRFGKKCGCLYENVNGFRIGFKIEHFGDVGLLYKNIG